MNNQDGHHELIRRCLDNEATKEEFTNLENLLRNDSEFRKDYLRYLFIDSALARGIADVSKQTPTEEKASSPPTLRFAKWSSLAAATAAGVLIGLFCASVAWAIMAPRQPEERVVISILSESFESPSTPITEGFPTQTGEWGGDHARVVQSVKEHRPADGDSMLSLDSSPNSNLGYIQQIFDVSALPQAGEGETRILEVIASFLADQPGEKERYTLRIATFTERPEEIRKLWEGVLWRKMGGITLTMAKSGLSTPKDARGWQTISTIVEVPASARSVVISLAAGRLNPKAPKTPHYLDDVRANLVIGPFTKLKRIVTKRR